MSVADKATVTAVKWGVILVGGVLLVRWLGGQAVEAAKEVNPLGPGSTAADAAAQLDEAIAKDAPITPPIGIMEALFPVTIINRFLGDDEEAEVSKRLYGVRS